VSALGFKDDKYVYAADMSDNFMVHIFDIKKEKTKAGKLEPYCEAGKADRKRINSISIVPDSMDFVSAGITDHLYYWTVANGRIKSKKVSVPGATGKTRLTFSNVKHAASKTCFAACSDGNVYAL
jgi:hypothetical protein